MSKTKKVTLMKRNWSESPVFLAGKVCQRSLFQLNQLDFLAKVKQIIIVKYSATMFWLSITIFCSARSILDKSNLNLT